MRIRLRGGTQRHTAGKLRRGRTASWWVRHPATLGFKAICRSSRNLWRYFNPASKIFHINVSVETHRRDQPAQSNQTNAADRSNYLWTNSFAGRNGFQPTQRSRRRDESNHAASATFLQFDFSAPPAPMACLRYGSP